MPLSAAVYATPVIDRKAVMESRLILGKQFDVLIDRYIADAQDLLMDIDLFRSGSAYENIVHAAVKLNTVSRHVGAKRVGACAADIAKFLDRPDFTASLTNEEKLDYAIAVLRQSFEDYRRHILIGRL